MSIFKDYPWLPWRFNVPVGYWKNQGNQIQFMNYLGKKFNVKEMKDWYNVTTYVSFIIF